MVPIKLFLTLANGGTRGDFLAGWLGSLPNFIDSRWKVDTETGRSSSTSFCFKYLDHNSCHPDALTNLLAQNNMYLDSGATQMFSGACHGFELDKKINSLDNITVLKISIQDVNPNRLNWENVVKTYMSYNDVEPPMTNTDYHLELANLAATDENRCNFIENQLRKVRHRPDISFPAIELEYNKMFVPGGSIYVSNKLNISVDQSYHTLWDCNLRLATSSDEIFRFNKVWRYRDFFTDQ